MQSDSSKTKNELIEELNLLRKRVIVQEVIESEENVSDKNLDCGEIKILLDAAMELSSTLETEKVMQAATNHITRLVNIGTAAIYLVENEDLYLGAMTPSIGPDMPDEFRYAKLHNHLHIKEAIETNQVVCVPDTANETFTDEEQLIVDQRNLRSIWYVPISTARKRIGVFIISSQDKLATCTTRELDLCRALSNIIAISLQNSLLHKQVEEKKEELSITLNSIGDAVISTDRNGKIVLMNPKAEELCGHSFNKAKGQKIEKILNLINYQTKDKTTNPVHEVLNTKKQVSLSNHTTLISKSGKMYQISDSAAPIFGDDGNIVGVVLVFSDVSRQYAMREALKESEDNLTKAELIGEFGSWELDVKNKKISGSKGAAAIYGIEKEQYKLEYIQLFPLLEYREKLNNALNDLLQKNKPYDVEFKIKKANGEIRNIHSTARYNDKSKKVFGVVHDITERKNAEIALQESEKKYKDFFMNDLTGDFISDIDGKFIECNQAFLSILGLNSLQELQNYKASQFYANQKERKNFIELLRLKKEVKNFEITLKRVDGKPITVIENVLGIFDKKNNLIQMRGYLFDITDRKKAEEEILKEKEKAEAAERIKTEFLAQMSHEIRSPLNAVLSFTGILKELTNVLDREGIEDIDTCFSGISSASKRIIRTVDSILNMSDLQLGTYKVSKRKIDLVDLIADLIIEFEHLANQKQIELRFIKNVGEKVINTDDYALSQIIANLIDNAVKYTEKGYVEINLKVEDNISIKIIDTGIGISKEYLPKLFTPFTQEEQGYTRSYDGNGLGLALVHRYCDLINAKISVKSKKNKGTEFTLSLPSELNK